MRVSFKAAKFRKHRAKTNPFESVKQINLKSAYTEVDKDTEDS
jgi:hypothetical protein